MVAHRSAKRGEGVEVKGPLLYVGSVWQTGYSGESTHTDAHRRMRYTKLHLYFA